MGNPKEDSFSVNSQEVFGAPAENFSRGLLGVELAGFGPKEEGKVRDNWVVKEYGERIMVTPDRTSAYDKLICTVPGKGRVLNKLSEFWFERTQGIIDNHMKAVIHRNVLIARQAEEAVRIEFVVRGCIARTDTTTSIYHHYFNLGDREIYGIKFPDGLVANQELPMGPIVTPTTKPVSGHDEVLTNEEARDRMDSRFGRGAYANAQLVAMRLFNSGVRHHRERGLILADTKYEFGIYDGQLMLIDEIHTPDSSRLWLSRTYQERLEKGENPETFDKEILRRWLADNGFRGEEGKRVPVVDPAVIDQMILAYEAPYPMITGKNLPETPTDPLVIQREIQQAVYRYYNK